jgi:hypothetical protein
MSQVRLDQSHPRVRDALEDLQAQIKGRCPAASFIVVEGDDPEGIYLKTVVDIDDLDEVLDQDLLDRLFEIQVEQGMPIHVVPIWTLERVSKELSRRKSLLELIPRLP